MAISGASKKDVLFPECRKRIITEVIMRRHSLDIHNEVSLYPSEQVYDILRAYALACWLG